MPRGTVRDQGTHRRHDESIAAGLGVNASPIVHEGHILLWTDQFLYCIGKK